MSVPVAKRGQARGKVIEAALRLFAEHGISGTSLQMIADRIGVTKAAVYFQFRTKEEIVTAVMEPVMDRLEAIVTEAESIAPRAAQLDHVVGNLVDLVVEHRTMAAILERDPALASMMTGNARWFRITEDLGDLLRGPNPTTETSVAVVLIAGGLMMSGADPHLRELSDDQLRQALKSAMRKLFAVYE
jgi:AcrR family transcriptional regulator